MAKCKYCKKWQESSKRKDPSCRYCETIKEYVWGTSNVCSYDQGKFELVNSFWCDEYSHCKGVDACINRQKKKECVYCTQGEDVVIAVNSCFRLVKLRRRKNK